MSPLAIGLGWLAFGPIVFALAWACMTTENWLKRRATTNAAAARNPNTHVPPRNQCDNCRRHPALVWEIVNPQHGGGVRWVCVGCHNEGQIKGWWSRSLGATPSSLDFAVIDECEDIPDIEAYANGEAS